MKIERVLKGRNLEAYEKLKLALDPIWDTSTDDWEPPEIEQRATVAITTDSDGELAPSVLIDKKDTWAQRQIEPILKDYPNIAILIGQGEAYSFYPGSLDFKSHARTQRIHPGVSISHGRFRAGTVGCIVEVEDNARDVLGLITATHVVALNSSVHIGDVIYCPGKGCVKRIKKQYEIGTLSQQTVVLYPLNESLEEDPAEDVETDLDVALVILNENAKNREPLRTFVPNPENAHEGSGLDGGELLHVTECYPEDKLFSLLGQEVYMFGAVSGFKKGILDHVGIDRRIVRLPNQKNYLYRDLIGVSAVDGGPFSRNGDSGAIIYAADGRLVGFLIGADNSLSFACIGERAIKELNVKRIV